MADNLGFTRAAPVMGLYVAALVLLLLYPFDFSSPFASRKNSVTLGSTTDGAAFGPSGMLRGRGPFPDLYRSLVSGDGLTIELWLKTASAQQDGPARIISYSIGAWERNFTLGQEGNDLVIRLRTVRTDGNGMPSLRAANVFVAGKLHHVAVTYDFVERRVYIDGRLQATSSRVSGGFGSWDPSYVLVFGNEASGARPWNGSIAYAAIYDLALSADTIADKFRAGPPRSKLGRLPQPLLAYNFTQGLRMQGRLGEGKADFAHPSLETPTRVGTQSVHFSKYSGGRFLNLNLDGWDLVGNVLLFVPFGVLGFIFAERRTSSGAAAVLATVAAATVFSVTCEALQFFQSARTSSVLDIMTNAAGALAGALSYRFWILRKIPQRPVA